MAEWESVLPKLKLAYAAWSESKGKSIDTWLALCAEEIDFRSLASGGHNVPWTCNWTTRQGVRAYLEGLTAQFQMEHFTVERFVCQDDTIVVISGGKAFVEDSPCPDKLCVHMPAISKPGQWIACMPNRVFLRVRGSDAQKIDDVSY